MRIDIVTLFPQMFQSVLDASMLKRAAEDNGQRPAPVSYHLTNIRNHSTDKHRKVDRPPYGGGPGMVIQCQPVWDAVAAVEAADPTPATRIYMTPQGQRLEQSMVEHLANLPRLLILTGHYEAIDERVIQKLSPIERISVGDYVLSGGEIAAMVLIDAVVRLVPGVLGDEASAKHESFSTSIGGLLDYPHYTRPPKWMDMDVPPVLLSGNHAQIEAWRLEQSRKSSQEYRPDLLASDDGRPVNDFDG